MFAALRRLREEREASVLIEAPLPFRAGPLVSQRLQILLGFLEPTAGSLSYIVRKIPKSLFRVTSLWFVIPLIVLMALEVAISARPYIAEIWRRLRCWVALPTRLSEFAY